MVGDGGDNDADDDDDDNVTVIETHKETEKTRRMFKQRQR